MRRHRDFDPVGFVLLTIGVFLFNCVNLYTDLQVLGRLPGLRVVQAQVVGKDFLPSRSGSSYSLDSVTVSQEHAKVSVPYQIWQSTPSGAKIKVAYGLSGYPIYYTVHPDLFWPVVKSIFWILCSCLFLGWWLMQAIPMLLVFVRP